MAGMIYQRVTVHPGTPPLDKTLAAFKLDLKVRGFSRPQVTAIVNAARALRRGHLQTVIWLNSFI